MRQMKIPSLVEIIVSILAARGAYKYKSTLWGLQFGNGGVLGNRRLPRKRDNNGFCMQYDPRLKCRGILSTSKMIRPSTRIPTAAADSIVEGVPA